MNEVVLWKKIKEKGKVKTNRYSIISLIKVKDANTQRNGEENILFSVYTYFLSMVSVLVFSFVFFTFF